MLHKRQVLTKTQCAALLERSRSQGKPTPLDDAAHSRNISSPVYTQTTDVEIEVNGLMTYDREVIKMDLMKVQEANQNGSRYPSSAKAAASSGLK